MVRTRTETCVRDGAVYRVETTWDDETGNSEIREFDSDGKLVRRCDWRIWSGTEKRGDQIGRTLDGDTDGVVALCEVPFLAVRDRTSVARPPDVG